MENANWLIALKANKKSQRKKRKAIASLALRIAVFATPLEIAQHARPTRLMFYSKANALSQKNVPPQNIKPWALTAPSIVNPAPLDAKSVHSITPRAELNARPATLKNLKAKMVGAIQKD
jgi:hypothetical protein